MKTEKALLLFILILLFGATGCDGNDPPVVEPPVVPPVGQLIDPLVNPPVNPSGNTPPQFTAEPGEEMFLMGKVWKLDGILDLETHTLKKLTSGDNADSYSMLFNSDSTATGKILNTEMTVSLSRPFFHLSETEEENEEAQLFARIASKIIGCEYFLEDSVMKFYNEDNKTCLVFKIKSVRDKTGTLYYYSPSFVTSSGRWVIRDNSNGGAKGQLIDGGDVYIPEDIPDNFKQTGVKVKFSGDVRQTPFIEIDTFRIGSTESYYLINLTSLEEIP
ncbi:MAG: hypothetical protein LBB84_08220 [Tannerellaceae bacterium]|nr:hypothetical protein [Tannerellaceae bacterium]